jgi:hypothetical protein
MHPRGGAPVRVRAQWNDGLDERLKQWTDAYLDQSLSRKAAYDLRQLALEYKSWDSHLFRRAFPDDAARALHGKLASAEMIARIKTLLDPLETPRAAASAVNELIVARRLAVAVRQPSKIGGNLALQLAD